MARELFVLRHGRSLANERGLIASSMASAGQDFGLTAEGHLQVRANLEEARGLVSGPVSICASPLLRARETAEITADIFGTRVDVDGRLIERGFGDLEMDSDERYEAVWALDRQDPTHRTWRVESVADVLERLLGLVNELQADPSAGAVILVTHGDVASILICASSEAPLTQHREVGGLETGQLRALEWPPLAEPPIFGSDS